MANRLSFSFSPLKDGAGVTVGAAALLAIALGERVLAVIGWVGLYIGLLTISLSVGVAGEPWTKRVWRKSMLWKFALVALLGTPAVAISWWLWPRPILVAYQLCYRTITTALPGGQPALSRYELAVRYLNGRSHDAVYFKVTQASFVLGGVPGAFPAQNDPIRVTSDTRNALAAMAVDFNPPRPTPVVADGAYRVTARYGRSPEGPFDGTMDVGGPLTVSVSPDGRGTLLAFGEFVGSDPRRVERECHMVQKS